MASALPGQGPGRRGVQGGTRRSGGARMALRARNPAVGCAPSGGREGGREPERRWGLPGAAARGAEGSEGARARGSRRERRRTGRTARAKAGGRERRGIWGRWRVLRLASGGDTDRDVARKKESPCFRDASLLFIDPDPF